MWRARSEGKGEHIYSTLTVPTLTDQNARYHVIPGIVKTQERDLGHQTTHKRTKCLSELDEASRWTCPPGRPEPCVEAETHDDQKNTRGKVNLEGRTKAHSPQGGASVGIKNGCRGQQGA